MFLAASFAQSGHCPCWTRYSISNICSRIVFVRTYISSIPHKRSNTAHERTSFWIVIDTRSLFECGSVQMKWASVNRTLFSPLSFFRQIERSSADSGRASVHVCGGERNRSQFRQNDTEARAPNQPYDWVQTKGSDTLFGDSFRDVDTKNMTGGEDAVVKVLATRIHLFRRHATHKLAELGTMGVPGNGSISSWIPRLFDIHTAICT